MEREWYQPIEHPRVETTIEERAAILVDLLHLTDALPPMPRRPLSAPPFRELCERAEASLVAKVLALHEALDASAIPHAFGGALALAYYTLEPRATAGVNVKFTADPRAAIEVLRSLPDEVGWSDDDIQQIERDEQTRLWWGRTPIDLFFRSTDFHDRVAARIKWHPFASGQLPFVSAPDLAVFKALFDRPKDWLDIQAMHDAGSIVVDEVADMITSLLGDDARVARLRAMTD